MRNKHAAIVYNPVHTERDRVSAAVREQELRLGWEPSRWYETRAEDSGRSAADDAIGTRPEVVIVVGGDGTVRAVVDAIRSTGIPIALVPSGTGNLLARNLDMALADIESAVACAFVGGDRPVDIGVAELEDERGERSAHAFAVMAGMGLDAVMAERTSRLAKRRLGWFAYVTPIARSIIANRLFHLDYRIDDGRMTSTRAHTIIVGNCGTLTGNMLLIPSAVVDDGLLDVMAMRPTGFLSWARIGTRLTLQDAARRFRPRREPRRRVRDLHALTYAQGKRFDAHFEVPHTIELDGDAFGKAVRVRISIQEAAIRVRTARAEGGDRGASTERRRPRPAANR